MAGFTSDNINDLNHRAAKRYVFGEYAEFYSDVAYKIPSVVEGSDGNVYGNLTADNLGNDPVTDGGVNWQLGVLNPVEAAVLRAGRRNWLINGNLNTTIVNQRAFAGGQPAAGVYGYDRWKGDTLGTRIEQIVENTEVIDETFVISWVGGTGTADVDGVTGLSSGDSFTLDTSTNFSVIVPTDATYVQVEPGATATDFEDVRVCDVEVSCRCYYKKILYTNSAIMVVGHATGTTAGFAGFRFETMRIPPTVTISSGVLALRSNGADSGGAISTSNITVDSFKILVSGATGMAAGAAMSIFSSANNSIILDSEL